MNVNNGTKQRPLRILLVEDSDSDIFLFRQALSEINLDCELTILKNGAEGLAFARREGGNAGGPIPDLAVLDLNLPLSGGAVILDAIRRNKELESLPVVVFTGSSRNSERNKAEAMHIERFLTKPRTLEEFLQFGQVLKSVLTANPELRHLAYPHMSDEEAAQAGQDK